MPTVAFLIFCAFVSTHCYQEDHRISGYGVVVWCPKREPKLHTACNVPETTSCYYVIKGEFEVCLGKKKDRPQVMKCMGNKWRISCNEQNCRDDPHCKYVHIKPKLAKCPEAKPKIGSDCVYHKKKRCSYGEKFCDKKKKPHKVYRCIGQKLNWVGGIPSTGRYGPLIVGQWEEDCSRRTCKENPYCTEIPQIPDYCTEEIPDMMQNCTSNRDCLEGLTCIKGQGRPHCFNHNIYFQTGCPCESHDDCPEACYGPQKGCGAWHF